MHGVRWIALVAFALGASSACVTSRVSGARSQFAQDVTCPGDRVVVKPASVLVPAAAPPPEVASDPQRLSMWRRKDAERRRAIRQETFYVAQGCGQSRVYHCFYCVDMGSETDCGMEPVCEEEGGCHASTTQPKSVVCDGGLAVTQ